MSASGGQQGGQPEKPTDSSAQRETDLAFLDNIDELNTNWPDYQVRVRCSSAPPARGPMLGDGGTTLLLHTMAEPGPVVQAPAGGLTGCRHDLPVVCTTAAPATPARVGQQQRVTVRLFRHRLCMHAGVPERH